MQENEDFRVPKEMRAGEQEAIFGEQFIYACCRWASIYREPMEGQSVDLCTLNSSAISCSNTRSRIKCKIN